MKTKLKDKIIKRLQYVLTIIGVSEDYICNAIKGEWDHETNLYEDGKYIDVYDWFLTQMPSKEQHQEFFNYISFRKTGITVNLDAWWDTITEDTIATFKEKKRFINHLIKILNDEKED